MKTKNIFILFALFAIVFSLAACSTKPKISNFYMAKDDQGTNKTTTFAPTDALILFFDVNGVRNGTPFEARWYVLNVANRDPNTPFKIMDQNYSSVDHASLPFGEFGQLADWAISGGCLHVGQ